MFCLVFEAGRGSEIMTTVKLLFQHNVALSRSELATRAEEVRRECAGPAGMLKAFGVTVEAEGVPETNSTIVTYSCPSRYFKRKKLKKLFEEKIPFMEVKTNSKITWLEEQNDY